MRASEHMPPAGVLLQRNRLIAVGSLVGRAGRAVGGRSRAPMIKPLQEYPESKHTPLAPKDYRGTSHIRKRHPLGPYRRPIRRVLGGS